MSESAERLLREKAIPPVEPSDSDGATGSEGGSRSGCNTETIMDSGEMGTRSEADRARFLLNGVAWVQGGLYMVAGLALEFSQARMFGTMASRPLGIAFMVAAVFLFMSAMRRPVSSVSILTGALAAIAVGILGWNLTPDDGLFAFVLSPWVEVLFVGWWIGAYAQQRRAQVLISRG